MTPLATTAELIQRGKEGDRQAQAEIMARYEGLIRDSVGRPLKRDGVGIDRCSDLLQEARLRALEYLPGFRGTTEAELVSWLRLVCRSRVADSLRGACRKKRDKRATVSLSAVNDRADGGPSPSQHLLRQEHLRQIMGQIFHLPEPQRTALRLHYLDGLPIASVARRMRKTAASVDGLVRRGIKTLQGRMGGPCSLPGTR